MSEMLAIIKRPKFGVGDRGTVTLTFHTYTSENTAALQVLNLERVSEALLQANVEDVSQLEGKPCWVEDGNGLIIYKRMWRA